MSGHWRRSPSEGRDDRPVKTRAADTLVAPGGNSRGLIALKTLSLTNQGNTGSHGVIARPQTTNGKPWPAPLPTQEGSLIRFEHERHLDSPCGQSARRRRRVLSFEPASSALPSSTPPVDCWWRRRATVQSVEARWCVESRVRAPRPPRRFRY